ncbi:MAG: type II secretion system minor pseudopilin GspK [Burkholderiales bacterium]|nr:type II secretion system minor pseudopilin GspK [Burkholderiales bacterium]MDE2397977.1 type II secretion system minor pseudopilin GspK [Burkholderiales bacterium]
MTPGASARRRPRRQRGAALLLAMVILTLVATLAAGMVWQQTRAVDIETAERAHAQAEWVLTGALDWARLILREDARSGRPTRLDAPWATPLAEARLSTFLAADQDNNAEGGPDAFLSGSIVDAQSRWNLRNLVDAKGQLDPTQLAALQRLCESAGIDPGVATTIGQGLAAALAPVPTDASAQTQPIAPQRLSQLAWLGVDAATLARLAPLATLLPVPTTVDANTASSEVLQAAIAGLDGGTAERLIQARKRAAFTSVADIQRLTGTIKVDPARVGFRSDYFEIDGRLRLDGKVLEERSLVVRRGLEVVVLQRERYSVPLGESG